MSYDPLEIKVRFANAYLNALLKSIGKVTRMDIYSVVTRQMRGSGRLILIDEEELAKLTKESERTEFVKMRRAA